MCEKRLFEFTILTHSQIIYCVKKLIVTAHAGELRRARLFD